MRYAARMRRLALALVLLSGCKMAPPRPMPSADWTRGAGVSLRSQSDGAWMKSVLQDAEGDLRGAGFRTVERAQAGDLDLLVSLDNGEVAVQVQRGGERVDQYSIAFHDLPCEGGMTVDAACVGREVAARLVESRAAEAAVGHSQPAPPVAAAPARSGKLAVLDLRNFAPDLTPQNAQYFTDLVRGAALKAHPQMEILTRENLLVLLQATGRKLDECEGECEVDTGRRIGADEIVSGELQKLGTLYKLTLRLHDTRAGHLLSTAQASGKSIEELDGAAQKAAAELFGK